MTTLRSILVYLVMLLASASLACNGEPESKNTGGSAPAGGTEEGPKVTMGADPSTGGGDRDPQPAFGDDEPYALDDVQTRYTRQVDGVGKLYAVFHTSKGDVRCRLYEEKAPRTVDNFVGLALGLKAWRDPATQEKVTTPLYDGTTFHRVVAGFLIMGGDPTGYGNGGPGFAIDDELHPELRHNQVGVLSMAQSAPNTAGSQFFITLDAAPQLDGRFTVFGLCENHTVLEAMGSVEVAPNTDRPLEPLVLEGITLERSGDVP